jgi:hypothetical protein
MIFNKVMELSSNVEIKAVTPIVFEGKEKANTIHDEKPMFITEQSNQVTFKQMANEMDKIQFSDEKEDFAVKIKNCSLSESDKTKLLQALWLK